MFHSKQWYYSLHRDFQNCYSTRRSPTGFFSSNSSSNSSSNATRAHYTTIQRILHPESNSTCRRQRALRVLHYRFQKRNSTHRRQGDLLEMHPCVSQDLPMTFQAFQPQVLTKATPVTPIAPETFQSFQTFQSFMTFQPFQAILQCSSISRESTPFQHSPIRMHILHILQFYNFYSSIGFHRKLHRVPVGQLQTLQTLHSSKKGRCCDIGQIDRFSIIELNPSFVLSSDNTNCKNDIQLFLQLFDELSVYRDYH